MIFDDKLKKLAFDTTDEALVAKYQQGDTKALNELIDRHKDLIKYKVQGFRSVPVPIPAVYGEGLKILSVAARQFNPEANVKFRTFLDSNLRGLNRYTHKHKNVLHFPENKMLKITKFKEVSDLLSQQYGRPPSDWQLADALGWAIPEVKETRRKLSQRELAASQLENVVGRKQEDDSIIARHNETAEFLYYSLTPEQKMVFDYALGRHGKPKLKTDAMIATRTGLSPSKVNRIRKDLAKKIQNS